MSSTDVIQVTNVSPSATSEQMRTLFGFLGKIEELRLFPPDESPLPVTSRVCFVKFQDADSAVVSQHLTNTVFVDRALIVVPYAEGIIPDEAKALSLVAPANAVAGLLPGGGLLPTPNPLGQIGAVPLAALGAPTLDPTLAALTLPGASLNSQVLSALALDTFPDYRINPSALLEQSLAADQLLKLMTTVDPKLNHVTAGLVSPALKSDTSNKDIEEAMKRVREAQSLISAAIEPDKKDDKGKKHSSRSRSRSRRRRTPSSSRHRRSRSRSRRRSHSKSRSRRRSKSPRRRRTHSRERSRRSRSASKPREKKREEKEKKRSKTPPKSYSTTRRSRSTSRDRRRRKSRSASRSPKKMRSPKRKPSRSPSPRRHKKEKKKDKDREKNRDERERSTSKKKKSKDKDKDRERRSEGEKDVKKVTRDYDEEEQGYDSEKEKLEQMMVTEASPTQLSESGLERGSGDSVKDSKVNGDDHHEEDMDMSD
ncbi:serine/arginine-rich splicing factor 11 isoform X1 [Spea bombifrons]|uniref:serine/arginine-rich splicing factor 11 isoform X1 n=1 Tax=Spea bombifrons TaxID=233779 RepID=UPI00234BE78E|nr:serine/arginine-rich splicing factor 11 isoform X1 [Spea bombifrons]